MLLGVPVGLESFGLGGVGEGRAHDDVTALAGVINAVLANGV
jgi:hypothetical protein